MKVCIVGASGKLGRYLVQHALDRDSEVVGYGPLARLARLANPDDQVEACRRVFLTSDMTRRVDFALFMAEALENDELVHEASAIVGRPAQTERTT